MKKNKASSKKNKASSKKIAKIKQVWKKVKHEAFDETGRVENLVMHKAFIYPWYRSGEKKTQAFMASIKDK